MQPAVDPAVSKPIIPPVTTVVPLSVSTTSVADRLKEIEDLHNMKLLTDPEYENQRAKIIAEL